MICGPHPPGGLRKSRILKELGVIFAEHIGTTRVRGNAEDLIGNADATLGCFSQRVRKPKKMLKISRLAN